MNKVYIATCTVDVVGMEEWANFVKKATIVKRQGNGDAHHVQNSCYHIARSEKELRGLLDSSFKGRLVHVKIEYVRDAHVLDSAFSSVYPSVGKYRIHERSNTYSIKDRANKTFGAFKSRIEAVTYLINEL